MMRNVSEAPRLRLGAAAAVMIVAAALQADVILRFDGAKLDRITVRSATYEQVEYSLAGISRPQRVPADQVEKIIYAGQRELQSARALQAQSAWLKAAEAFARVASGGEEPYAEAGAFGEAESFAWYFFETGQDGPRAKEKLDGYLKAYTPKKGFHVPFALYLAGRVELLLGNKAQAGSRFQELAGLPGNSRRLLAELGKGELQLAQGDAQGAAITFNTAMNQAKRLNMGTLYRMAVAWRGRALVAEKDYQRAIDFLEGYLKGGGEEIIFDRATAQASNALGDAYAGKGGTESQWEALYRYLWTTVLFRNWRAECAEAFYKAAQLAKALGVQADAEKLLQRLKSDFPETVWARKVK